MLRDRDLLYQADGCSPPVQRQDAITAIDQRPYQPIYSSSHKSRIDERARARERSTEVVPDRVENGRRGRRRENVGETNRERHRYGRDCLIYADWGSS